MKFIIPLFFILSGCCTQVVKPSISDSAKMNKVAKVAKVAKKPIVPTKKIPQSTFSTLAKMSNSFSSPGWKKIRKYQVPGFTMSQVTSPFLLGFESQNGSQIFMIKAKISDSRSMTSDYIASITNMSVFKKAFQLLKPASMRIQNHSNGTHVLHISATGNGDGKTLYRRKGIKTLFENSYIPLKFNNGKYSILRVHYRGSVSNKSDYNQFKKYIDTIKLPQYVKPLL